MGDCFSFEHHFIACVWNFQKKRNRFCQKENFRKAQKACIFTKGKYHAYFPMNVPKF